LITQTLASEFRAELLAIAEWWCARAIDYPRGGFVGEVSVEDVVRPSAGKGGIYTARLLWFFSEFSRFSGDTRYHALAARAHSYINRYLWDENYGGMYWQVDADGQVLNDHKQLYAQAFAIYGLSAYYRLCGDAEVLRQAMALFELIQSRALDTEAHGYIEAFTRDWSSRDDVRLSEQDLSAPKSLNTHLHILEAYTALYQVSPSMRVAKAIKHCLGFFREHIIDKEQGHLRMFLTRDWRDVSCSYSFGHDIETSWLMWEAVEALGDQALREQYRPLVLALAARVREQAIGNAGEVWDGYDFQHRTLIKARVWWVQAEALVGLLNAYQLSGDADYFQAFENVWAFIQRFQKDHERGEWYWFSSLDQNRGECKAGFWKGPYHNGRAMMEVYRRLSAMADVSLNETVKYAPLSADSSASG